MAEEFAAKKFAEAGTGNHFLEVRDILQNEFGIDDEDILAAGLLHDTLEDTETTYEELVENFGDSVADMVEEVSHPKNYNHKQKIEFYEKLNHISFGAKMVKLADFKSHLVKFIGAFTGENNLPKFTHNEYCVFIRAFLENCENCPAKNIVAELNETLNKHIAGQI